MDFFVAFCNHFKNYPKYLHLSLQAIFSREEEAQISHKIAMFPGIKMSEKDSDFIEDQIGNYTDLSAAKDYGGYSPVVIIEHLKLRSKINVSVGKINEVVYNELIATCKTIDLLIEQGADLKSPEVIGYNREENPVALLKSRELAPLLVLDEAMALDEKWKEYLSYNPVGIPAFRGLDSISSFARMRDSILPTRSPLWILEKSWIEKLKKMGCRPKTIPVMEAGTELRKKYIDMLFSIKEVVDSLPDSRLSVADL